MNVNNRDSSMGAVDMNPRVQRKLAGVAVKPLSILVEKSWQSGDIPGECKKGNIMPLLKRDEKVKSFRKQRNSNSDWEGRRGRDRLLQSGWAIRGTGRQRARYHKGFKNYLRCIPA